jgi:glycosyltransferase involved in cell wall biosynthesis
VTGTEPKAYRLLSVIVPVYNERRTVGEIIRRMRRVDLPVDLEVVVVDDASTDGTDKVLAALEDSTVRVVQHPSNQGKAASIRTGLSRARGDLVLIQDADLEYDPDDWPKMLAPIMKGKADVVYGSRFIGERRTMRYWPHLGNRFLTLVTDVLYNTNLSDIETCYKLFDRSVLDGITIESDRFEFEPEITAKVLRRGHRIYEVPISFAGREQDEGMKFTRADTGRALVTLMKYRFKRVS